MDIRVVTGQPRQNLPDPDRASGPQGPQDLVGLVSPPGFSAGGRGCLSLSAVLPVEFQAFPQIPVFLVYGSDSAARSFIVAPAPDNLPAPRKGTFFSCLEEARLRSGLDKIPRGKLNPQVLAMAWNLQESDRNTM
jgi:hypothetical protein